MSTQRILVTGGCGYIGSVLTKRLHELGHYVFVIDDLSSGIRKNLPKNIVFYQESLLSKNILPILKKEKPNIIFHLAAKKSIYDSLKRPLEFSNANIFGSLNLLNAASVLGIKKFIFTSTAAVYGENFNGVLQVEDQLPTPISPYGASKLAIEGYIHYYNKTYGMQGIVLRFANVYGSGGKTNAKGVIDIFLEQIISSSPITVHGNGQQIRDFIHVQDVVDMCLFFASQDYHKKTNGRHIFNIATGKGVSVNGIVTQIQTVTGLKPKVIYEENHFFGQMKSVLSPVLAKKILGWESKYTLQKGISEILSSYTSLAQSI